MDQIDVRIIEALQEDASLTMAQLAELVGSTPSTCLRRVKALQKNGFLERSVYMANAACLERGLQAIIVVTTKEHGHRKRLQFADRLKKEPAIASAFGVTGDVDAVLLGNFVNMEEYQSTCDRLFDNDPHVVRYTTNFVTEVYKRVSSVPCDALSEKLKRDI